MFVSSTVKEKKTMISSIQFNFQVHIDIYFLLLCFLKLIHIYLLIHIKLGNIGVQPQRSCLLIVSKTHIEKVTLLKQELLTLISFHHNRLQHACNVVKRFW